MEINDSFRVDLPVEETWRVLMDIERIAPCLPGAQLQEIAGEEYRGVVKVKVGPITAQYKGAAQFESRDDVAHVAVIKGSGRDTRGQGNASATITMRLEPDGAGTAVSVSTDLAITGKVAQFGRGVMADVSAKLLAQFVANLERDVLSEPAVDLVAAAEEDGRGRGRRRRRRRRRPAGGADRPGAVGPARRATARSRPTTASTVRTIDSPEVAPVDLLEMGGSPVLKRLLPLVGARRSCWCCGGSAAGAGPRPEPAGTLESNSCSILGGPCWASIPGCRRCGYGAVTGRGRDTRAVAYGVIATAPADPLPGAARPARRRARRARGRAAPRARWRSSGCCSRTTPAPRSRSARRAGSRSWPRPASGSRSTQYSPNEVKLAVAGHGGADKEQVQLMVTRLLHLGEVPRPPDAADALALALCHQWAAPLHDRIADVTDRTPAPPPPASTAPSPPPREGPVSEARRERRAPRGQRSPAGAAPMIGSVRGTVLERTPTGEVLVEVGGVGYRCLVPLGALPPLTPGRPGVPHDAPARARGRDDAVRLPDPRRARHVRDADRRERRRPEARARDPVGAPAHGAAAGGASTTTSTRSAWSRASGSAPRRS